MQCENGYNVTATAVCANAQKDQTVTVTYNFVSNSDAPIQRSFVGLYALDEKRSMQPIAQAYLCGNSKYDKNTRNGKCPNSGTVALKFTAKDPVEYKVAVRCCVFLLFFGMHT